MVYSQIEDFLQQYCHSSAPILLALSGGPDSICLFHCLLKYRSFYQLSFHVAHVDHGWRAESTEEARVLRQLAAKFQVPFYCKTLQPSLLEGNLEAACREERYLFFSSLAQEINFQALVTGHQQDDQTETVCKRILEGAHWSRWGGLLPENRQKGLRILRPLLSVSKKEIYQFLKENDLTAFEDPTNHNTTFLRARFRKKIFPWLSEQFKKDVGNSFLQASADAKELIDYFDDKLCPFLQLVEEGPWGSYLNFQSGTPYKLLEIKYILRLLSAKQEFFLSREIIEGIAKALLDYKASKIFMMGSQHIRVDRQRLFLLRSNSVPFWNEQKVCIGVHELADWKLHVQEQIYSSDLQKTSWKDGWRGHFIAYLPINENYLLKRKIEKADNESPIKKKWSECKIPLFLSHYFPFIYKGNEIFYDFLLGKAVEKLQEGVNCWRIEISNRF